MVASSFVDPLLLRAVPESVRADAKVAMGALGPPRFPTHTNLIQDTNNNAGVYPDVCVQGEVLEVPRRIYYKSPSRERTKDFTTTQRLVLACWLTRHHDGKVRQRALRQILRAEVDVAWTIPFVIQLCGEYVIEIGTDVFGFVTKVLPMRPNLQKDYAQFIHDNLDFVDITRQRTVSYWVAYYRDQHIQEQYPPLMAVEALFTLAPELSSVSRAGRNSVLAGEAMQA